MDGNGGVLELPPSRPSFDQQFSNKNTLKNSVGDMKFVDIKFSFESPTDKTPLVVFPGWSITLNTEKQLLECLTTGKQGLEETTSPLEPKRYYGRHVVSGEFPRRGGTVEEKHDISNEVIRRSELVAQLILSQEGKVDISADSEAGMDLIVAMKIYGDELLAKIRNIVIVSPAGVAGDDSTVELMARSIPHFGQDILTFAKSPIERRNIIRMGIEAALYVGKNLPRTLGEVNAIGSSEEYEGLKTLKKDLDKHGIKLGFIQAQSDRLTPAAKLWRRIAGEAGDTEETDIYLRGSKDLKLQPKDTEKQRRGKIRRFIETKEELNRKMREEGKTPPVDSITMVGGGHDNRIYGERDFGIKILRVLEQLGNPISAEQAAEFAKSEADIAQTKRYKKIEELAQRRMRTKRIFGPGLTKGIK